MNEPTGSIFGLLRRRSFRPKSYPLAPGWMTADYLSTLTPQEVARILAGEPDA